MSEKLTPERLLAEDKASINRLVAQVAALREALTRIQQWDELNPPNVAKIGDAQWLRDLVDAALAGTEAAAREHDQRLRLEGYEQAKAEDAAIIAAGITLGKQEADHASR